MEAEAVGESEEELEEGIVRQAEVRSVEVRQTEARLRGTNNVFDTRCK